jgi:hypothetical protein
MGEAVELVDPADQTADFDFPELHFRDLDVRRWERL